jgi:hypothetical protein
MLVVPGLGAHLCASPSIEGVGPIAQAEGGQQFGVTSAGLVRSVAVREHPSPRVLGAPDAGAEALELDDLAVVDE